MTSQSNKILFLRKLFVFDFICGLTGALFYYWFFDFMINILYLPKNMVVIQLLANFSYGVYGIILYLSKTKNLKFFKFLVTMNFIYAFLCLIASILLAMNKLYLGACLLFIEGLLIALLAQWELKVVRS